MTPALSCRAAETPSATLPAEPRSGVYLIADYLPAAVYEQDPLNVSFRIENTTAPSNLVLTARALDAKGVKIYDQALPIEAKPGFSSLSMTLDTARAARIEFELTRKAGSESLAKQALLLIREADPWPATSLRWGRLVEASSQDALTLVVRKQRLKEERTLAPLRWLFGGQDDAPRGGEHAYIFVPPGWPANYKDADSRELDIEKGDGVPLVLAVDRILSALKSSPKPAEKAADTPAIGSVVIVLPGADLELATDPRQYRMLLDGLLSRLRQMRASKVTLISPFVHGSNEPHRGALWKEVHAAAQLYGAKAVDPIDWMNEKYWRADPAVSGVYLGAPNAAGRKIVEQALADLLR